MATELPMMGAGDLDRRIVVLYQNPDVTRDETGGVIEDFITFKTLWARKEALAATEAYIGAQYAGRVGILWTVRYRTDLTTKMRIRDHEGREYDVTGVREGPPPRFERHEATLIDCWSRTEAAA